MFSLLRASLPLAGVRRAWILRVFCWIQHFNNPRRSRSRVRSWSHAFYSCQMWSTSHFTLSVLWIIILFCYYSLISTCGTVEDAVRERNGMQQPEDSCQTLKLGLDSGWLAGTLNDRDFVWREGKRARGEPCPWPWASCAPHRARKLPWMIHTLWAAMAWCDRAVQTLFAIVGAFAAFSLMTIAITTDYWLYSRAYICNATNATADESQMQAKKVRGDMTHSGLWRICCIEGKTKSDKFLTFVTLTSFLLRTLFFGTERVFFFFNPTVDYPAGPWVVGWMWQIGAAGSMRSFFYLCLSHFFGLCKLHPEYKTRRFPWCI